MFDFTFKKLSQMMKKSGRTEMKPQKAQLFFHTLAAANLSLDPPSQMLQPRRRKRWERTLKSLPWICLYISVTEILMLYSKQHATLWKLFGRESRLVRWPTTLVSLCCGTVFEKNWNNIENVIFLLACHYNIIYQISAISMEKDFLIGSTSKGKILLYISLLSLQ